MNLTNYSPPTAFLGERTDTHTRVPMLAALLGLALPGLGHLYLGRRLWAGLYFLLGLIVPPGAWALFVYLGANSLGVYFSVVALAVGAWCFQAGHAFVLATRSENYVLTKYNHVPTYVLFAAHFVIAAGLLHYAQREVVADIFTVESAAMAPAILPGDQVLIAKLGVGEIDYGDLVVYEHHYDAAYTASDIEVGRVFGREGDLLEANDGVWRRNGGVIETNVVGTVEMLNHSDAASWRMEEMVAFERVDPASGRYRVLRQPGWEDRLESESFGPIEVPPGHVFVVADNLDGPWDSRKYGAIRLSKILGRPTLVWGTQAPDGMDLERVGQAIEASLTR